MSIKLSINESPHQFAYEDIQEVRDYATEGQKITDLFHACVQASSVEEAMTQNLCSENREAKKIAEDYFSQKQFENFIENLPEFITKQKDHSDALNLVATIRDPFLQELAVEIILNYYWTEEDNFSEIEKSIEKIDDSKIKCEVFSCIAKKLATQGESDTALTWAQKIAVDHSDIQSKTLASLATTLTAMENIDSAIECVELIPEEDILYSRTLSTIAAKMADMGNFDHAIIVAEEINSPSLKENAFEYISLQIEDQLEDCIWLSKTDFETGAPD